MNWLNSFKKNPTGLSDLTFAIVDAADKCAQIFKGRIDEKFGKDSNKAIASYIQVRYEFLFFFTHVTMRSVFSKLGNDKRNKLQDLLGPVLLDTTTEAWFGHWPIEFKERVKKDFRDNINRAETEYSRYKPIHEKDGSPKDTLFWELSKNIARLSGYESNPETIRQCMVFSTKIFADMDLGKLIKSVARGI